MRRSKNSDGLDDVFKALRKASKQDLRVGQVIENLRRTLAKEMGDRKEKGIVDIFYFSNKKLAKEIERMVTKCGWCDGTGKIVNYDETYPCEHCKGKGKW